MPGGWTDQSERDLLFTIIKLCAPTGMNWEEVSAMMGELGYAYTKEAVRQHYQKMRKSTSLGSTTSTNTGGNSGPSTPSTSRRTAARTPASRKRSKLAATEGEDQDDEELFATPSKRQKGVKTEKENGDSNAFIQDGIGSGTTNGNVVDLAGNGSGSGNGNGNGNGEIKDEDGEEFVDLVGGIGNVYA